MKIKSAFIRANLRQILQGMELAPVAQDRPSFFHTQRVLNPVILVRGLGKSNEHRR
jgi:hypothetical protein